MRYILTQDQLDNLVFKFLDTKRFIQIKRGNKVYFVTKSNLEVADIVFDLKYKICYPYPYFIKSVAEFFDLGFADTEDIIGRWVGKKLDSEVNNVVQVKQIWFFYADEQYL
jgi:hypothetical protein